MEIITVIILFLMGAQFGVALTSSIIVHPIIVHATRKTAIEIFKPFFDKTHKAVLYLSIAVSILALVFSYLSGNWWWFGITLIMHLNGPYTIFFMMPLNNRLMAADVDPNSDQVATDIQQWGKLHSIRTILNGLVFISLIVIFVNK